MEASQLSAKDRVFAAATSLWEKAGRQAFPTVDAVRKEAKVNMNDASAFMKDWRLMQNSQALPGAVVIPDAVQQAQAQALAALWAAASDAAGDVLRGERLLWDKERAEIEAVAQEQGEAYEALARELAEVRATLAERDEQLAVERELVRSMQAQIDRLKGELTEAVSAEALAKARVDEVVKRADDLARELALSHDEATRQREAFADLQGDHARQRDECEQLRAREAAAREEAAKMRGQAESLAAQVAQQQTMLAALVEKAKQPENKQPKAAARKKAGNA